MCAREECCTKKKKVGKRRMGAEERGLESAVSPSALTGMMIKVDPAREKKVS